jgi:hypothetical protein
MHMSVSSLLLRVLLSLSLILNGMSAAAAMHLTDGRGNGHAASAAAQPATESVPPCHQHQSAEPDAAGVDALPGDAVAQEHTEHATPDCCKSGACRCDCVHAAHAVPMPPTDGTLAFDHTRSSSPLTLAHATPALPHLIRPPIG